MTVLDTREIEKHLVWAFGAKAMQRFMMPTTNRHPVDELADVREQIKKLQEQERQLRDRVLEETSFIGDEYRAEIVMHHRETLDTKAIKREFGRERLEQFLKRAEVLIVKLERLENGDSHEWTD